MLGLILGALLSWGAMEAEPMGWIGRVIGGRPENIGLEPPVSAPKLVRVPQLEFDENIGREKQAASLQSSGPSLSGYDDGDHAPGRDFVGNGALPKSDIGRRGGFSTPATSGGYAEIVRRSLAIVFDFQDQIRLIEHVALLNKPHLLNVQIGSQFHDRCRARVRQRIFCRVRAATAFLSRAARVPGRKDRGEQGEKARDGLKRHDSALAVSEPRRSFGGVRRTSLLDEIVALQAVLLFGLLATIAFIRGFPLTASKPRWIAAGAAGAIMSVLCLKPLVSGYIWLPWL